MRFEDSQAAVRCLPDDLHPLAVLNRYSSNYLLAVQQFEHLQALGLCGSQDSIETLSTRSATGHLLGDRLTQGQRPYNAVIVLSGDGGSNTVAHGIHASADEYVQAMPLIFGQGGGACDAHTLTQSGLADYIEHLAGQPLFDLYPWDLWVEPEADGSSRHEKVLLHVGVGDSAAIAYGVNQDKYRHRIKDTGSAVQRLHQYAVGAQATMASHQFTWRWQEDSEPQATFDWVAVNGARMGGVDHFPGRFQEAGFHYRGAANKLGWLALAGRLLVRQPPPFEEGKEISFYAAPTRLGQIVRLQFDGETIDLPAVQSKLELAKAIGSRITIKVADRPLAVARRSANP